jgi:hypothetical protein
MRSATARKKGRRGDFRHTKLDWVKTHIGQLVSRYPDKWVCIVDGEVKAAGSCDEAHNAAEQYNHDRTLVMFVEGDAYVYAFAS